MRTAVVTALCVLLAACIPTAAADDPSSTLPGVLDLTPDNFDFVVNGKLHALVEFYAPWCGHCKSLVPELKKVGESVLSDPALKGRVIVVKVDANEHRDLGTKFGVTGFPTLKWFGRGKDASTPEDYRGGRSAEKILDFIKTKLDEDQTYGRVAVLDAIARGFLTGDKDMLIQQMETKMSELTAPDLDKAAIYLKIMKNVKDKGDDYLTTERARVTRLLDSGNVNQEKVIELSQKVSILSAFIPEQ